MQTIRMRLRRKAWAFNDRQAFAIGRTVFPHLLFCTYLAFFASVVLTNSVDLPTKVFRWLVMPSCIASLGCLALTIDGRRFLFGVARCSSRSVTIWTLIAYLVFLTIATRLRTDVPPDVTQRLAGLVLRRSMDVSAFAFVTAYLVVSYNEFFKRFFIAAAAILSISAAVNLGAFIKEVGVGPILGSRLEAMFGTPQFRNSTHAGPLWASYTMAALGVLATVAMAKAEQSIVKLASVILIFATLATQARGAIGLFAIGIPLIAIVNSRSRGVVVTLAVIATFILALSISQIREALIGRGSSFRFDLSKEYLLTTWNQHRWLGFGLQREIWVSIANNPFEQPHNTVVWAYVRGGIVAGLACITMLAGSIFWTFTHWRRTKNLGPFALIAALCVTAVTEIGFLPWSANWLWIMFWLPLGVGIGVEVTERGRNLGKTSQGLVVFMRSAKDFVTRYSADRMARVMCPGRMR